MLFKYETINEYVCSICESTQENWHKEGRCYICNGKMKFKNIQKETLTCPICGKIFKCSEYLKTIFKDDDKVRFLANMITHMRHDHITSWNKCWGRYGSSYQGYWFGDYEEEKAKVNERQKRQLIRKAKDFLNRNHFTVDDFKKLKNTTDETITVAEKYLNN